MSPGDAPIMMFYGRPENVNLTHSIKFIIITFLKYSFSVPLGRKKTEFIQCLINFGQTSQKRPNSSTKVTSASNVIEKSLGRQF